LNSLLSASGNKVEAFWTTTFANLLNGKDMTDMLKCGGGGGGGGGAASEEAPAAAAAVEEPEEEEEEEEEEEMEFDLFD